MPLQGTFDVLDFAETLRLIGQQQLTGRLHVRTRNFGANLFFEEGYLTGADQSEHQAAANSGDVRGRMEEICFEMLDAGRGNFEFHPGRASSLPGASRHEVDDVLTRARRRLDEWHVLQETIPSLEVQPRLVAELGRPEVTIDAERWRMLTVMDGRRNLRAIGRTLNLSDFDVCRVVKTLMDDQIVELEGRAAALAASGRDQMPTVPTPDFAASELVVLTHTGHDDRALPLPVGGTETFDEPTAALPALPAERDTGETVVIDAELFDNPAGAVPAHPLGEAGTPAPGSRPDDDPSGTERGGADEDPDGSGRRRSRRMVRIRSRNPRED